VPGPRHRLVRSVGFLERDEAICIKLVHRTVVHPSTVPSKVPFRPRLSTRTVAAAMLVWVDAWEVPARLAAPFHGSVAANAVQLLGHLVIAAAVVVAAFVLARAAVGSQRTKVAAAVWGLAAGLVNPSFLLGFNSWLPALPHIHGASLAVLLLWGLPTLWALPFLIISRAAARPPSDDSVDRIVFFGGAWLVCVTPVRWVWETIASSQRQDEVCGGARCNVGLFDPQVYGLAASGVALLLLLLALIRIERRRRWVTAVRRGEMPGWRIADGDDASHDALPSMLRIEDGAPRATLLRVDDAVDDPFRSSGLVEPVAAVPGQRVRQP
jgi:hypothetical protein